MFIVPKSISTENIFLGKLGFIGDFPTELTNNIIWVIIKTNIVFENDW